MPSATVKPKKIVHSKRRPKAKPMTNVEIFQQIIADPKFILKAIQNSVTFKKLKDKYGYKRGVSYQHRMQTTRCKNKERLVFYSNGQRLILKGRHYPYHK